MGRFSFGNCCNGWSRFRANWILNHDVPMQTLPKPKEAETTEDQTGGGELAKIEEQPDILIIRSIDPRVEKNGVDHHTDKYELMTRTIEPQLVVRRGQPFYLDITLSREYDPDRDGISFIFSVDDEENPSHGNNTMIAIPLLARRERDYSWNVILESSKENVITVQVTTAPDAIVAKWLMDVDTRLLENGAYSYSWETKIYLLFNPWCKHDQVYMKNEDWREETVLNDTGIIWRGTYNRLKPVIWMYDQFEKDILDCSIYLVRVVGKVKNGYRSDPVRVTRALAAAVNAADDNGAIMGNWTTDHSGGTPPTSWIGSKEIMQKYYKKKKPVKYGQCWVFSGVLATICRSLGIPARTITNYKSAHDTQNSLTVDYFMDEKGNIMEELNNDSVWNYHVWNEVWMQRPDLGREFNGWQAIDATPQELSEDVYRCGPASVQAVKQGEILRPYDNAFLFSEVNADKVFWKYSGPTQPLKLIRKDIFGIGKMICTKAAGRFEREDITSSYKYPEKTGEERTTMMKALKQSHNLFSRYYLNEDFNDVHFDFHLKDDIKIGQPFDVTLSMKNRSRTKDYRINVLLKVDVVTYTGKVGDSVKNGTYDVTVKNDQTHELKLNVTFDEYIKRVVDQCAFSITCLAKIHDSNYEYYAQDDFRIRKPDIKFTLQSTAMENKELTVDVHVENPLPVPLKKGVFTVEAPGVEKIIKLKVKSTVPPGDKATGQFKFTPPRTGRYSIAAKFQCKEMDDVDGYKIIMVEPNVEENGLSNELR